MNKKKFVIAGVLFGLIGVVQVASAKNANPGILPLQSHAHGMTYGDWSARWWQWAYSLPVSQNPFFDETGCANGESGQFGPVWFLTGVINTSGVAERTCTVPTGKALFFPILNIECSTLEGNGDTEADLRDCTDSFMGFVTEVHAEVDGVPVTNAKAYRAASPLFTYGPLPNENVLQFIGFDAPAGATSLAASDGFWLMLAPLSAGEHDVHFGGTFGDPINFTLSITYHLTVQ